MICGLARADAGTVEVDGRRMHPDAVEAKKAIGLVPQDIALYPGLSARENLRYFGKLQGLRRRRLQSALIVTVGRVLFGVEWGSTVAAGAVVFAFSLVGTGVGLLVGSVARTAEQAQAFGIPVAVGLAMLGGCMWPLDVVAAPVRTIGHLTPHAWAMDAWIALIFKGGGLSDIALNLAVLLAFGIGLLVLSSLLLRRTLLRGA